MSVSDALGFPFADALQLCYQTGRPVSGGDPRGIVLVAAAGNTNSNFLSVPASLPVVLSVAATNPADQLKTIGDSFEPINGWGSNYNDKLDVSAPGICIWSTDFVDTLFGNSGQYSYYGSNGYDEGSYYQFSGTSAASPIVAGIAALVLEKADSLTAEEVYNAIRFGCEKVGGYSYSNTSESGKCLELGFGRVNACNALNIIQELSIDEIEAFVPSFTVTHQNPVNGVLRGQINGTANYAVTIVNLMGEIVYQSDVNSDSYFEVDMTLFSNGLYLLNIQDRDNLDWVTSKVVKQ